MSAGKPAVPIEADIIMLCNRIQPRVSIQLDSSSCGDLLSSSEVLCRTVFHSSKIWKRWFEVTPLRRTTLPNK